MRRAVNFRRNMDADFAGILDKITEPVFRIEHIFTRQLFAFAVLDRRLKPKARIRRQSMFYRIVFAGIA